MNLTKLKLTGVVLGSLLLLHCPSGGGGGLNPLALLGLGGGSPVRPIPSLTVSYNGADYGSGETLDFGSEITNASSGKTFTLTITNSGTGDLSLSGSPIVEKSGANESDFTLVQPSSSSLSAGATATFTITFVPSADGTREATITINSNDEGIPSYELQLTGEGSGAAPRIAISEGSTSYAHNSTINMGSVQEATSGSARTFTIKNTGSQSLTFTNNPPIDKAGTNNGDFSLGQPSNSSLAAGASRTFTITFSPSVEGSKTAFLTIETNDPNTATYQLNLEATATPEPQPQIKIEHNSVDYTGGGAIPTFGTVWPNDVSSSKTITISNIGTDTLTGVAVSSGGTDPSQFAKTALPATSIAPGNSITFNLTFEPTATGSKTAKFTVTSSDGDDGSASSADLTVSGTGHTGRDVLVSWTAAKEKGVSDTGGGYMICYSQTSGFNPASVDGSTIFCEAQAWPGTGTTPTSKVITVGYHGTWYFKVYAFAGFNVTGGPPSAQTSVVVPQ